MPNFQTVKMARYHGRGDAIQEYLLGEHAPPNSPFAWFPAFPAAAQLLNQDLFYDDWQGGYNANKWTVTEVDGGGDAAGAVTGTADLGTLFTLDDADNDLQQLQHLHSWTPAAGAWAACYARLQAAEATQSDVYCGWASVDTAVVASAPAHHAYFKKDDGDTIVNGSTNDNNGATETANLITDFTEAVDYDFGVVVKATSASAGTVFFQYKLASATAWTQVTKTTDFPAGALRFLLLCQRGTTGASTMLVKRWAIATYAGG